MNPPEGITPQHADRLVALLDMMGELNREGLAFLVGYTASRNIDLAIEAYGALMGTELPLESS
jgi:hypothetical protein